MTHNTVCEFIEESIERTLHDYDKEASALERIFDAFVTSRKTKTKVYLEHDLYERFQREKLAVNDDVDVIDQPRWRAGTPITVILPNKHWCGYDAQRLAAERIDTVNAQKKEETREFPTYAKAV